MDRIGWQMDSFLWRGRWGSSCRTAAICSSMTVDCKQQQSIAGCVLWPMKAALTGAPLKASGSCCPTGNHNAQEQAEACLKLLMMLCAFSTLAG